jgi:hypothetical protein
MHLFKKTKNVPPLILTKDILLKIEAEITKPWEELRENIMEKNAKKYREHNLEIAEKGYSYKISTDSNISKKTYTDEEIHNESRKQETIEKELSYPLRAPVIKYKDSEKEIEVTSINELYDYNLHYKFESLEYTVYGKDAKVIDIKFTSENSFLNSSPSQNELKVSSADESWTIATTERIYELLKKNESPGSLFNNALTKIVFLLALPIITVYLFGQIFWWLISLTNTESFFANWLAILIYMFVFFYSFIKYDDIYNQILPGTILEDEVPNRVRFTNKTGWVLLLGVISTIIYEIASWVWSLMGRGS